MSLQAVPSGERVHIGIFGRRNAGKSSLINAITGQNLAIVSDVKGTTTDPVLKSMELLPLGPVVFIDTPGLDDTGQLGGQRVQKALQMLNKTDIAVLVADASAMEPGEGEAGIPAGLSRQDREILDRIRQKKIPYLVVYNKWDLAEETPRPEGENVICVSAATGWQIRELKERIAGCMPEGRKEKPIAADLVRPGDLVILVVPIDSAAPKGRLILPQQQTIRDLLDAGAAAVVTRDAELKETMAKLGCRPALVITDSQVFERVAAEVPEDIPLTSFSILFARYKGSLKTLAAGAAALDTLQAGDRVLIAEGCTHHRQCEDIGTVKLPRWIAAHTGKKAVFDFVSGTEFPEDLSPYRLVIHCGGCMLNETEMGHRIRRALEQQVPITNYGTAIAHMKGILKRSTAMFSLETE